jgi:hypothetical protein
VAARGWMALKELFFPLPDGPGPEKLKGRIEGQHAVEIICGAAWFFQVAGPVLQGLYRDLNGPARIGRHVVFGYGHCTGKSK